MVGPATDTSVGGPIADEIPSALPDDDKDMGAAMPQDGVVLSEAQLLQVWVPSLGLLCLSGNQAVMSRNGTYVERQFTSRTQSVDFLGNLQVFKQTSIFNVRSALQGNDVLMAHNDAHVHTGGGECPPPNCPAVAVLHAALVPPH
jgi:hypothetical protein